MKLKKMSSVRLCTLLYKINLGLVSKKNYFKYKLNTYFTRDRHFHNLQRLQAQTLRSSNVETMTIALMSFWV